MSLNPDEIIMMIENYTLWVNDVISPEDLKNIYGLECNDNMIHLNLINVDMDHLQSIESCYEDKLVGLSPFLSFKLPSKYKFQQFKKKNKMDCPHEVNHVIQYWLQNSRESNQYVSCSICGKKLELTSYCSNCDEDMNEVNEYQRRSELINSLYNDDNIHELESLSFKSQFFLYCYLRGYANHELQRVDSYDSKDSILLPILESSEEELVFLFKSNLIYPHNLRESGMTINDEGGYSINVLSEYYQFHIVDHGEKLSLEDLQSRLMSELAENITLLQDEILCLWDKLVIDEAIQYINYLGDNYGMNFNSNKKIRPILKDLNEKFSIGQIYNLLFRAAKNIVAFSQSKDCKGYPHAINSFSGRLESDAEKTIVNGWELKNYNRDSRIQRSIASEVLLEALLKLSDAESFYKRPIDWYTSLDLSDEVVTDKIICRHCHSDSILFKQSSKAIKIQCLSCSEMSLYRITE